MKKIFIGLCFGAILLSSCGGIESDAQRLADIACKAKKEAMNVTSANFEELQEKMKGLEKELKEISEELEEKYKDREDEFRKAFEKAFESCK